MSDDVWLEDARTDRAIELLRLCAAKTDADGEVIPTYRYTRSFGRVAEYLIDLVWASREETVTIHTRREKRDPVVATVTIDVVDRDGNRWEQEGSVRRDEHAYCWHALAACRALLQYCHDDGEPMSPSEVIAMLEGQREQALRDAREARA